MPCRVLCVVLALGVPATGAADDDLVELFDALGSPAPAASASAPPSARGSTVRVAVEGVRDGRGLVRVLLYDDAEAYTSGDAARAVGYGDAPAAVGRVDVAVSAQGPGPYAAFAYHDANGDDAFERVGGRPAEGYGFSGGVDYLQPPFARAAKVTAAGSVRLLYLESVRRR